MLSTINKLKRPIVAVFSGAFATLGFAPYNIWPATILALICLLLVLHRQTAKDAAMLGLLWGLGHFGTGIAWVYEVIYHFGGLPLPVGLSLIGLLIFYLSLYPSLFAYVLRRFPHLPDTLSLLIFAPALWLVVDWLRGWILTGFPWLWPGYSQIDSPLASLAPLLGVQGITLAMMLIAGACVLLITQKRAVFLAPIVVVIVGAFGLGKVEWVAPVTEKPVKIAMIQGNIPQKLKWLPSQRWPTLLSYQDMTRQNWDADIVIWPEAAIPALERDVPDFLSRIDAAARYNNTALVTGVLDQHKDGRYFNNVVTLGSNGTTSYAYPAKEVYSKHHLLVFGEFVPFEEWLRPLAPFFNLAMSSFTPGEYIQPNLNAAGYKLATALCYEILFHQQVRANIHEDTDFILTLSNDAWFGKSIGPHQHLEIARMRALENGKPVLRATNTGLTAAIDYKGNIQEEIPQFEKTFLRADVLTTKGETPYTRIGEWPLNIWVALCMGIVLLSTMKRRNKDKAGQQ
ncbi:apolipoprotein N-acyltransferase [Veronia nyctiphanis]|uniref:Apolipoprotein N-acyltransferase n=1 Tax=Veronia nyctiphanis TaxID=1278244 RepID=A0A4Q0YR70_9GAMM|nr:apolipoprotein N-acyltransferase [Veronia nyctiphanis]RXJ73083.1 apolipoprotein N-acyltransferase [Veronia nyctiphanis]